jgi:hypothetical protein
MNTLKSKLISILSAVAFIVTANTFVNAKDLNMQGFSGTINTTLTTGLSIRASERDCLLQDGYSYNHVADGIGNVTAANVTTGAYDSAATATLLLSGANKNAETSKSCATFQTDGYGNTSTNRVEYGNVNSDDGNLNYDYLDVIDATSKVFTEISGRTDAGIGINASLIGSYNPVNDLNAPNFKKMSAEGQDEIESDLTLLDAYMTTSIDTAGGGYLDITLGRFVTSWGEATFIPVGANGLVTNALDLSKLRAPGASIRDALVPTEQISLSTTTGDWGIDAYYQFSADKIQLDPAGAFYGNEVAGTGEAGQKILASAPHLNENNTGKEFCAATYIMGDLGKAASEAQNVCNAAALTASTAIATRHLHDATYLQQRGLGAATSTNWANYLGAVPSAASGSASGVVVVGKLSTFTNTAADAAAVWATSNLDAVDFTKGALVNFYRAGDKEAKDDGQFGVKLSNYFDVGNGIDFSLYYSNYHSKQPYIQMVGKGGLLAGDVVGAFTYIKTEYGSTSTPTGYTSLAENDDADSNVYKAFLNGAWDSGICGGVGADFFAKPTFGLGTYEVESGKQVWMKKNQRKVIVSPTDGKTRMFHDPTACAATPNPYRTMFSTFTPDLAAAVTPLNYAKYRLIYPEDQQIIGTSFNTNFGGTTVQGELAYRPNFALGHSLGDQANQIADASGTTAALALSGMSLGQLTADGVTGFVTMKTVVDGLLGTDKYTDLIAGTKRSSLNPITDTGSAGNDYYSTAYVEKDVITLDIGTTTSFAASHPVTAGLGADSAYLLTEVAMVSVSDVNNRRDGFIARNGFNEGNGEFLCLGWAKDLTSAQIATINAGLANAGTDYVVGRTDLSNASFTNAGSSIGDAIFGNGKYCESQMGADPTSWSMRLVGGATYNNVNNTPWSVSPTFAYANDFEGYAPSSIGGFAEGRSSLSLGVTARKGQALSVALNYVNQMGKETTSNGRADMDTMSLTASYAF